MAKIQIKEIAEKNSFNLNNLFRVVYNNKTIKTYGYSSNMVDESDVDRIVALYEKAYPEEIAAIEQMKAEEQAREKAREEAREKAEQEQREIDAHLTENFKNMILSSCETIDGYRVDKQLGLVFGECLYVASDLKKLTAGMFYNIDESSFKGVELGETDIIEQAREYAIKKMKRVAAIRGANAIIGIDAESSISSNNVVHVTIYGTAVHLEKV